MKYIIRGIDAAHSLAHRRKARPAHLARLQTLMSLGRLLLAGPIPAIDSPDPGNAGYLGSLVIAEFDSIEAAISWAQDDPYLEAGAWVDVVVEPFVLVLP